MLYSKQQAKVECELGGEIKEATLQPSSSPEQKKMEGLEIQFL
jgi:hypothetical protein